MVRVESGKRQFQNPFLLLAKNEDFFPWVARALGYWVSSRNGSDVLVHKTPDRSMCVCHILGEEAWLHREISMLSLFFEPMIAKIGRSVFHDLCKSRAAGLCLPRLHVARLGAFSSSSTGQSRMEAVN